VKYLPSLNTSFALVCFLFGLAAQGQDLVQTSATTFLNDKAKSRRVGIKVEVRGLTPEKAAAVVAKSLGGTSKLLKSGEYEIQGSRIGTVRVNLGGKAAANPAADGRSHWFDPLIKLVNTSLAPVEVITEPVSYDKVDDFSEAVRSLKKAGAKGTNAWRAISTQVNVEIFAPGTDPKSPENTKLLSSVLQNYYSPEHEKQVLGVLKPPKIRREYILPVHAAFAEKLEIPGYLPTPDELFFDYHYLQTYARQIGDPEGKSMTEIREAVLRLDKPVDPVVVKNSRLQASSALVYAFPDDPLSKEIVERGANKTRPAIEFREPNTDFDVKRTIDWALGFVEASAENGAFSHDALMAENSGLHPIAIEQLRSHSGTDRLRIIRYDMAAEPYSDFDSSRAGRKLWKQVWNRFTHGPAEVYQLSELGGKAPVQLGGETVIWHRRPIHRRTILGKYNPGLINYNLQEALENKLFEARVMNKYVPGSMPRTFALSEVDDITLATVNVDKLVALKTKLDKAHPEGWVLKGAYDYNTDRDFIITEKDDFAKLAKDAQTDFDAMIADIRAKKPDLDFEAVLNEMKKRPEFKGYLLSEYLKKPDLTLVQERLKILSEYRVEMVEGKLLSSHSTIDRYFQKKNFSEKVKSGARWLTDTDPDAKLIRKTVEAWFENLPEHFRNIPYGLDIALTEENGVKAVRMIETNPGGNSGFLHKWTSSSRALNRYLKDYVKRAEQGKAYLGLTGTEQMQLLNSEIKVLGLQSQRHFPGMYFLKDEIVDPSLCIRAALRHYFDAGLLPGYRGPSSMAKPVPEQLDHSGKKVAAWLVASVSTLLLGGTLVFGTRSEN